MVVQDPPIRPTAVNDHPEPPRDESELEEKAAVWAFIWTLFVFKIVTVFLILWASHDFASAALVSVTTWFWLAIPLFAVGGPLAYRYRLVKMRMKREQLRRAEWMLDEAMAAEHRTTIGHKPE